VNCKEPSPSRQDKGGGGGGERGEDGGGLGGLVKSYSVIRYTTPGVMHLYLMQNWNSACAFR